MADKKQCDKCQNYFDPDIFKITISRFGGGRSFDLCGQCICDYIYRLATDCRQPDVPRYFYLFGNPEEETKPPKGV